MKICKNCTHAISIHNITGCEYILKIDDITLERKLCKCICSYPVDIKIDDITLMVTGKR